MPPLTAESKRFKIKQMSIEEIIKEVIEAAPTSKQVPTLRELQAEIKRRLEFNPALDTIRKALNALGYYPEEKQSHRWVYRARGGRRKE